jgi:hypothetical protein
MPRVLEQLFPTFTSPSPRLPAIGDWLLNEVWQTKEYPHRDPVASCTHARKKSTS